jgi:hypothetical protein
VTATSRPTRDDEGRAGRERILIVLSEWSYWCEELLGPLETFDKVGYQVDFATSPGKKPVVTGSQTRWVALCQPPWAIRRW